MTYYLKKKIKNKILMTTLIRTFGDSQTIIVFGPRKNTTGTYCETYLFCLENFIL